ncbi:hypothetical protein Ddc_21540 [Ditylenchus destructor]|nr:hypothetical protein Ddc_21540 [Ditylenchus destructor]
MENRRMARLYRKRPPMTASPVPSKNGALSKMSSEDCSGGWTARAVIAVAGPASSSSTLRVSESDVEGGRLGGGADCQRQPRAGSPSRSLLSMRRPSSLPSLPAEWTGDCKHWVGTLVGVVTWEHLFVGHSGVAGKLGDKRAAWAEKGGKMSFAHASNFPNQRLEPS